MGGEGRGGEGRGRKGGHACEERAGQGPGARARWCWSRRLHSHHPLLPPHIQLTRPAVPAAARRVQGGQVAARAAPGGRGQGDGGERGQDQGRACGRGGGGGEKGGRACKRVGVTSRHGGRGVRACVGRVPAPPARGHTRARARVKGGAPLVSASRRDRCPSRRGRVSDPQTAASTVYTQNDRCSLCVCARPLCWLARAAGASRPAPPPSHASHARRITLPTTLLNRPTPQGTALEASRPASFPQALDTAHPSRAHVRTRRANGGGGGGSPKFRSLSPPTLPAHLHPPTRSEEARPPWPPLQPPSAARRGGGQKTGRRRARALQLLTGRRRRGGRRHSRSCPPPRQGSAATRPAAHGPRMASWRRRAACGLFVWTEALRGRSLTSRAVGVLGERSEGERFFQPGLVLPLSLLPSRAHALQASRPAADVATDLISARTACAHACIASSSGRARCLKRPLAAHACATGVSLNPPRSLSSLSPVPISSVPRVAAAPHLSTFTVGHTHAPTKRGTGGREKHLHAPPTRSSATPFPLHH